MQSNKSLAIWASQTYSQTGGVNNWTQYQLSLLGTSNKFNVYSAGSSSTVLSIYDAYNFYGTAANAGDTMLLSTNGTSFTSGTLGVRTITAPPMTLTSGAFTTTSIYVGQSAYYFVKPDGTKFWQQSGASLVYEFNVATPYDLSTATRTSRTFSLTTTKPFCFSADGTTLFTYAATVINSYALGTAWDITTISAYPNGTCTITIPTTTNWVAGSGNISSIRFSPDGTKLLLQNGNTTYGNACTGNWALWTLSVPWVLGSLVSATTTNATTYNYNPGGSYGMMMGSEFAPDGRSNFVCTGTYGSPNCDNSYFYLYATTFGTAWNLTTWANPLGSSPALSALTQPNRQANNGVMCFNATGTSVNYIGYNSGSISYVRTWTCDYWNKYNFNISGYSLGATPTAAYYAAPTVRVDAQTTAARVNLFDYQVYMASSSTTQAVVYKPSAGYIAAGDTLSLNGTTTVTTSAVTEGSTGAVAAVPIYTAGNRSYANKNYTFPSDANGTICVRFSADGSQAFALLASGMPYGVGIYQFNLSTPWDISTASFGNMVLSMTLRNAGNGSFDFSADGFRLITWGMYITGSGAPTTSANGYVYDHTLSQSFNIGTATYVGAFSTNLDSASYYVTGLRFTPNGQQVLYVYNDATNYYVRYSALGTAYRIQTSGSVIAWSSTSTTGIYDALLTPDGLNIVTLGFAVTTSNTLGTANSMATATTTNNIGSATNKWTWPTGTVTSTASCIVGYFSPDGTKFYVNSGVSNTAVLWQMNVMVIPQTSYTCTFPTQGAAPTSVVVPDRSVSQTISTTLSSGVMTFAASAVGTNARGIALKITSPQINTSITNATLSMWRS